MSGEGARPRPRPRPVGGPAPCAAPGTCPRVTTSRTLCRDPLRERPQGVYPRSRGLGRARSGAATCAAGGARACQPLPSAQHAPLRRAAARLRVIGARTLMKPPEPSLLRGLLLHPHIVSAPVPSPRDHHVLWSHEPAAARDGRATRARLPPPLHAASARRPDRLHGRPSRRGGPVEGTHAAARPLPAAVQEVEGRGGHAGMVRGRDDVRVR